MTPLHLQILLWLHTRPSCYAENEPQHAKSKAVIQYTTDLLRQGLIEAHATNESGYCTTDKGKAYVDALCNLPLPVCKWVIPPCSTS